MGFLYRICSNQRAELLACMDTSVLSMGHRKNVTVARLVFVSLIVGCCFFRFCCCCCFRRPTANAKQPRAIKMRLGFKMKDKIKMSV